MLVLCHSCSGFVPDDCALCPHCQKDVRVEESEGAQARPSDLDHCLTAADVGAGDANAPNAAARLMRRVWKGTLIAGSSMVLAACYGAPPDQYDDSTGGPWDDHESASGGAGGELSASTGGLDGNGTGGLGGLGGQSP